MQSGCKVGCNVLFSFLIPSKIGLKVAILGGLGAYLTLICIPTQGLGGGRSIQLSYGNIFNIGHSPMVQRFLQLGAKLGAKFLIEPKKLLDYGCFCAYCGCFLPLLNPLAGA